MLLVEACFLLFMCLFKPSPAKAKCLVRGFIIKSILPLQTYHTIWYDLRKRNVSSKGGKGHGASHQTQMARGRARPA
jgi:hypothetical protein